RGDVGFPNHFTACRKRKTFHSIFKLADMPRPSIVAKKISGVITYGPPGRTFASRTQKERFA
ncbi:hypothetical protein, partial [Tritonibacter sp. SIMBA_163]|uniref:hypothetical protein n=1 Tax=Tritonibacter sp. SIMBA_163 TaxID=3080868 RepID=UPI00398188EA